MDLLKVLLGILRFLLYSNMVHSALTLKLDLLSVLPIRRNRRY